MKITNLIPTHNNLRNEITFNRYRSTPKDLWIGKKAIIIRTEDEKLYLWDWHHRCTLAFKLGIYEIPKIFYEIYDYTYEQLATPNLDKGYVTPFDPRTECRLPDFWDFKVKCLEEPLPEFYLQAHPDEYKEPREIFTVAELAERAVILDD